MSYYRDIDHNLTAQKLSSQRPHDGDRLNIEQQDQNLLQLLFLAKDIATT